MWHVRKTGEVLTEFWWGNLEERGVDGGIILKWIFKKWDGGIEWIGLAQDKDKWPALVNAVVNHLVL